MANNQKPEHKIVFDTAIAAGINPDTAKLLLAQMMPKVQILQVTYIRQTLIRWE